MALSSTIMLEAGGEGENGRAAVGFVILERSKRRGLSIAEVCFQCKMTSKGLIYQFSCYNDFDSVVICKKLNSDNKTWSECHDLARRLLDPNSGIENNVPGADHYYNPLLCSPWWAKYMEIVGVVGNHVFLDSTKRLIG